MNPGDEYAAPTVVNLEITERCNARCGHCYNTWRENAAARRSLTKEGFDRLLDMFSDAGVFHVVLTGGEPLLNREVLEHACRTLTARGMSISVNSNLMDAGEEQLKRLRDAGVDHILTSLNSCRPEVHDGMARRSGSLARVVRGISCAVKGGIRVSANMIVGCRNRNDVYGTAAFAAELGCQKMFATRTVPPVEARNGFGPEAYALMPGEALNVLDQLLQAKEETGIMIGSLVSYPLCLLGDLEKYRDFVGRGCPAQAGHRMSIGVDGVAHCCVHEERGYGNVFEEGIGKVYGNMREWHTGRYRNPGCDGCRYVRICDTGCRMSAAGHYGSLRAPDPLMVGKENIRRELPDIDAGGIDRFLPPGAAYFVPEGVRFREERTAFLVNVRWANTVGVDKVTGGFLRDRQRTGTRFTLAEFGEGKARLLYGLLAKAAVRSEDVRLPGAEAMTGLGLDPSKLSLPAPPGGSDA